MLSRKAGKNIFKIALVTENVTLSNPGIWESQQSSNLASLGIGDDGEPWKLCGKVDHIALMTQMKVSPSSHNLSR